MSVLRVLGGIAAPLLSRPVGLVRGKRPHKQPPAQAVRLEPVANSMLAALPKLHCQRLLSGLEMATLDFGDVLHEWGVTVAAGELQAAGLIQYSRGNIKILDHQGLESASCACYEIVRAMQAGKVAHEAEKALAA